MIFRNDVSTRERELRISNKKKNTHRISARTKEGRNLSTDFSKPRDSGKPKLSSFYLFSSSPLFTLAPRATRL